MLEAEKKIARNNKTTEHLLPDTHLSNEQSERVKNKEWMYVFMPHFLSCHCQDCHVAWENSLLSIPVCGVGIFICQKESAVVQKI